jgi:tetratricopeptide (TPR) repeat protein
VAALRRSVTLEPDNWRHHLRRSYGTWGEERRRAAHHVLTLLPGCPMAHLLAATVFVARNALTQAERELDAGLASMADESTVGERFTPVALHWLKGLLCLARNEENEALAAFDRELALEPRGHLYARECSANAWYAIGACHVRRGDRPAARAAFGQAIARIPRHPMAHAGLALASGSSHVVPNAGDGSVDAALARAVALAATGAVADAVPRIARALSSAPPGNAGWLLPVEPLLRVAANRAAWAPVLGMLRTRAS